MNDDFFCGRLLCFSFLVFCLVCLVVFAAFMVFLVCFGRLFWLLLKFL